MARLSMMKRRLASIALGAFVQTLLLAPALADLTPATAHDLGPFKTCQAAIVAMSKTADGRTKAADACGQAMNYYGKKRDAATSLDDRCYYGLYASSGATEAAFAKYDYRTGADKTLQAQGLAYVNDVIAKCGAEPKLEAAAQALRANNFPP